MSTANPNTNPLSSLFGSEPQTPGPYSGLVSSSDTLSFPDVYTFDDALNDMAMADTHAPILGVNGLGETQHVDLDSESPHVLISGGTGGCKTGIARALAAQALGNGAQVVFLDYKQHSHTWARNLPNVAYADTLPEIGNALVMLGQEVRRRNTMVKEIRMANLDNPLFDESSIDVGPRLVIIFEEMNSTFEKLQKMTRNIFRNSAEYTAMDAFDDIVFMGRAALTHMIAIAQFAGVKATGGSAIRENFNTRILVRYTKNQWNMLAWDCGYPVSTPEQQGRGFVCRAGKARQTQFLLLSEPEARAYVQSRQTLSVRPSTDRTELSAPKTPVPSTFKGA